MPFERLDTDMLLGELFFYEISEDNILFIAMVCAVRVSPDEVHRGIDKHGSLVAPSGLFLKPA